MVHVDKSLLQKSNFIEGKEDLVMIILLYLREYIQKVN